jgi:glycerophosphoryl diester phosphodiesterase
MKLIKIAVLAGFVLAINHDSQAQKKALQELVFQSPKAMISFFKYGKDKPPVISGHRGGTTAGFPENCIATFANTLKHTPAFFEIDPRLTKDSIPVLMHDETLDRTTNGTGKVSDYTYEELQNFNLKDPSGLVTAYKIPTLTEVIKWSEGKTVVNLDHKDVPLEMTKKILKESANKVIMVTVHSPEQAKFYLHDNPDLMLSAFVKTKEELFAYQKAGVPWKNLIAYIGSVNKPENKELIDLLHERGVMCMISAAPSYDKLATYEERKEKYRQTFEYGADILESDLPIEVASAIKPDISR